MIVEEIENLLNLSKALSIAVNSRFMAPEHGAIIWKTFLKTTSIDIEKPISKRDNFQER